LTLSGITNHDEYSLVREDQEEELENKPNFGTLTLKRKKEEKERDAKMDQLRKKLKTDDEGESCFLCIIIYIYYNVQ
jgi:talin